MEAEKQMSWSSFFDFYKYITNPDNGNKIRCPDCDELVDIVIAPSFNLRIYGKAIIRCRNDKCDYAKEPFAIESCFETRDLFKR